MKKLSITTHILVGDGKFEKPKFTMTCTDSSNGETVTTGKVYDSTIHEILLTVLSSINRDGSVGKVLKKDIKKIEKELISYGANYKLWA